MDAIAWVGVRTDRFQPMATYVDEALGLGAIERGPDRSVHAMPEGQLIEVIGPSDREHEHFVTGPVPGFRVGDLRSAAAGIEEAGGELVGSSSLVDDRTGWQHFRAPDGFLYEVVMGDFEPRPPSGRGVGVQGLPWVGTATDRFEDMTRFVERVLGREPEMEEPGVKIYRTVGGSVIEVFGPGHRYHDTYRAESRGPVVAFQVDRLIESWDRLVDAGAERIGEVDGAGDWEWAHVRLPDGNLWEILARRSP
jgi:catechol 2,3-dioxygenase-like lactoylglutathione lyase family enzyme